MSFSRAKIQRFNDVKPIDYSPSPAKYNIAALTNKLKWDVPSHPERYTKSKKSPTNSETNSCRSTPCFQTPIISKKKRILPLSLIKPKQSGAEELMEKIVELNNKDTYIKELTEQIDDMQTTISRLMSTQSSAERTIEDQRAEINNKNSHIEETMGHLDELTAENQELKKHNLDLESRLTDCSDEKSALVAEKAKLSAENKSLEERTAYLSNLLDEVETSVKTFEASLRESHIQIKDWKSKYECLSKLVNNKLANHSQQLKEKDEEFQAKEDELKQKHIEEIEMLRAQFETQLTTNESDHENCNAQLKERDDKIKLLEEKFKENQKLKIYNLDLESRLTDCSDEKSALMIEKAKLSAENKNLEERTAYLSSLLDEVEDSVKSLCTDLQGMYIETGDLGSKFKDWYKVVDSKLASHSQQLKQKDEDFHAKEDELKQKHIEEIEALRAQFETQLAANGSDHVNCNTQLRERDDKIKLLEENFKEISLLTEMQMKDKLQEIEESYQIKLQQQQDEADAKLKHQQEESEAILKECQEISEYSIIQTELEKNELRKQLAIKEQQLEEMALTSNQMKQQLRTFTITINTSLETIEVLKNRLINSDRDVEQLKEELELAEEKLLNYESKVGDLLEQLREAQNANDELDMQYESSLKLIRAEIDTFKNKLIKRVAQFEDSVKTKRGNEQQLCEEIYKQLHEQQDWNNDAESVIKESQLVIEDLEKTNDQLNSDNGALRALNEQYEVKVKEYEAEVEEAAEIRRKYIDVSGKYDELSQQFENLAQDLHTLKKDKHQGRSYQCQQGKDSNMKQGELFQHNVDLELENYNLSKLVDKLKKEVNDLKKSKRHIKSAEDKENIASPGRTVNRVESPGPLRPKN